MHRRCKITTSGEVLFLLPASTLINGAPGRIRTCDPRLRRPLLYPAELRAHNTTKHGKINAKLLPNTGFKASERPTTKMVGEEGFEPPTSCSQSRRATRLRYSPMNWLLQKARMIPARLHVVNQSRHFIVTTGYKYYFTSECSILLITG